MLAALSTAGAAPGRAQIGVEPVPSAKLARAGIVFDARATVADFKGRTEVAAGELHGGEHLTDVRGWIEVKWRDIDTGNGTRNRHMLKTVDEGRYPVIRFDIREVVPEGASGDSAAVLLRGSLTFHGATRPVEWPAVVRVRPDSVSAAADFPVDMREYGISPPARFLIARMGPVVVVHVRLVFVRDLEDGRRQTRGQLLPGSVGRSGRHTSAATSCL